MLEIVGNASIVVERFTFLFVLLEDDDDDDGDGDDIVKFIIINLKSTVKRSLSYHLVVSSLYCQRKVFLRIFLVNPLLICI